ncbi:MAG: TonB family protein [Planctomycetota bacterium]
MGDRTRLLAGALASVALHGLVWAAVPSWRPAEPLAGEGLRRPALEVVALAPEVVREILEPRVRPALPALQEAITTHAEAAFEWPALAVERPPAPIEVELVLDLLPRSLDAPATVHPPIVDRLRAVSPAPIVDVAPPPVEDAAPPAAASGPPSLADLSGLVLHREPLEYPAALLRRGIEGVASIAVEVGADGSVVATRVLLSSGNRTLDRAAQRNLRRWRFDPAAVAAVGRGWVFRQDVVFEILSDDRERAARGESTPSGGRGGRR